MVFVRLVVVALVHVFLILLSKEGAHAVVRINEIADKGSDGVCEGEDWIELYNDSPNAVQLDGYVLHDDQYPENAEEKFTFAVGTVLAGNAYDVLCCDGDGITNPKFKVGKSDTVTLLDASGNVVSTSGKLPGLGEENVTYALNNASGEYVQTWRPTPGELNVIASKPTKDLRAQNAEGTSFFGMDERGLPVSGFDAVVDLYAEVDASDWTNLWSHPYAETYIDVQRFIVKSATNGEHVLPSPGRMRTRGQSTLFYPICMGNTKAVPFKLDFASANSSQTLYGVETAYLRTHLSDESKMREWVIHRMLANFGLPHARTRHVRFYVNDVLLGFYNFVEAIDQEYVTARSFGFDSFDQHNNALYKVKTMSLGCGNEEEYRKERVEGFPDKCTSPNGAGGFDCCADDSWNEPKTCAPGYTVKEQPSRNDWDLNCWYTCLSNSGETSSSGGPYQFERGDHREKISPKYNNEGQCWWDFFDRFGKEKLSVVQAFYDEEHTTADDCGAFLLSQGLIDRDLGTNEWDSAMEEFINSHLSVKGACQNTQCSNKRQISDLIDVDNWLKNFAVYATIVEQDSPMGNGNNYFLAAHAGDGGTLNTPKWKMISYDHNNDVSAASTLCDAQCGNKDLKEWSVIRPTCKHLSENPLVGPLLLDENLHERYLVFVKKFVEETFSNSTFLEHMRLHSSQIEAIANESPDSEVYGNIDKNNIWNWISTRGEKILSQLARWHEKGDSSAFPIDSSVPCVTTDEEFCSSTLCTSPNGWGGYDCWAGSPTEACTCSSGTAKATGETTESMGQTYYLYTCCSDGSGTGEQCGEYRGGNDGMCRSDICTDYFNDCCAPGDEPRGCSIPGYTVSEGGTSSSWCWDGAYQCCPSSEIISSGITCRSDICTDIGNDCCAPWGEARGCSIPGYTVSEGGTSSSCWMFGSDAVYQCCTSSISDGITSHALPGLMFAVVVAFLLI